MQLKQLLKYCLRKPGTEQELPFGPGTIVVKVAGKMFILTGEDDPVKSVNLKCDPFYAMELRDRYKAVTPGYHMNKVHWNTVAFDGSIPDSEIKKMIDHSYEMVVNGLSQAAKKKLEG